MTGSKEIVLWLLGSVFFPFLQIGFSFATFEASGKIPWDIDMVQVSDIGPDEISGPSCKKRPENLSMPYRS